MVLLTFVWKCFQDRNFHGVVVGLYEQSIESWVGLHVYRSRKGVTCGNTRALQMYRLHKRLGDWFEMLPLDIISLNL